MPDPVLSARSRFNAIRQHRGDADPATLDARRDLVAARLAAFVEQVVADSPPLRPDQVQRISALLAPSRTEAAAG